MLRVLRKVVTMIPTVPVNHPVRLRPAGSSLHIRKPYPQEAYRIRVNSAACAIKTRPYMNLILVQIRNEVVVDVDICMA